MGMIQCHRFDLKGFVAGGFAIGGGAVVANDAQHVVAVGLIARERAQFAGDFGGCGIGHASHDRGQSARQCPALVRVITKAHVHQQPADVGIAKTQRAEVIGALRDFF